VGDAARGSPLQKLLNDLLPSKPFRKWLQLATGQTIRSHNLLARRFRRGKDYTLATGYNEEKPRLELTLSITPTTGSDDHETTENQPATNDKDTEESSPGVGGYLAHMAGDEDADNDNDGAGSDHGIEVPTDMSTGGRTSAAMKAKRVKADPAVYQAAAEDDEDDGVLFSMPASWNRMGLVLRDRGTMRFVKYVSAQAKGDRWDLVGEFEIEEEEDDDEGERDEAGDERRGEGGGGQGTAVAEVGESSTEVEGANDDDDDDDDDESDDSDD